MKHFLGRLVGTMGRWVTAKEGNSVTGFSGF